ncbi:MULTISPECIES: peptidoglycan-binding protein [unclassified Streptomyces]|uniref:peptidoglycan-binding protein n=1 Tax=unclassified Streptomyces TaxID=2593676 RepID=UPI0004BEB99B|nr:MULTISPECIES: peptidoglycan-binding protein [unclassified Streptomyces]
MEQLTKDGEGDVDAGGGAYDAPPRRRKPLLIGAGVLVVAVVSVVGALGLGGGGGADDDAAAPGRSSQVVAVTRATLTDRTEIDGQLGHGPQVPFPVKAEGTVTWLPATGRTVRRGQQVLRVNDRPVVLLYGSLPMYRELGVRQPAAGTEDAPASSDGAKTSPASPDDAKASPAASPSATAPAADPAPLHGMDVKQFESNLSALGYSGFTVDESYTTLTANAVKRWQKDLGLPQTGRVGAGDVVYAPGPVRVSGTSARVGDAASGNPVSYTSTSRMVTVSAPANDTDWARRGSEVSVELPDGHTVTGTVASLGSVASSSSGGAGDDGGATGGGSDGGSSGGGRAATVSVVITFDDQDALGRLQSGPVTVRHTEKQRKNVLTVPVAALTALAEGGYGLELADDGTEKGTKEGGPGAGRFVAVKTGLFAGGRVEVSGPDVHEGMKVRIPE